MALDLRAWLRRRNGEHDDALLDDPVGRPSGLQQWFESGTDALRASLGRIPRFWRRDHAVIPVQVDLVGESGRRQPLATRLLRPGQSPQEQAAASDPSADAPSPNPFASPSPQAEGLVEAWSFREPVLLRSTGRSSRLILYVALGLTGSALVWIVVAPLNQTVAVQGKLEPDTRVKAIQTPVAGTVDEVLVEEGQAVKAGQALLRFDLRDARSRLEAAETIRTKLLDENRIYAIALGEPGATDGLSANQAQQLRSQALDLSSRRDAAREDLRSAEARLRGYRQSLVTALDVADRYDALAQIGAVSTVQQLETRARAEELRSKVEESEADLARLRHVADGSEAGPSADYRGRIEANLRQIADLDRQIREARVQLDNGELRSPTRGTVFDLDVRRGSVATAAQPLLKVVPDEALSARVYVPSSVIGFIRPGQRADISLDTFPSADYGRLEARVQRIGTDALTPDEQRERLGQDASGLHYPAVLSLSRQTLPAGRIAIPLQPGMGLTADVHLRQRRMINVITGFFEDKKRSLERMR